MVVTAGLAVGLLILALSNPVVGDHEYVNPDSDATPICLPLVLELQVLVKPVPALAETVTGAPTVVFLEAVQFKASVMSTVYVPATQPLRSWWVDWPEGITPPLLAVQEYVYGGF